MFDKNAYMRAYAKNNRDKFNRYARNYRKNYPDVGRESNKLWQKRHPEKANAKSRRWYNKNKNLLFTQILNHYGSKCACCGENTTEFLVVDHVNNNGAEHRRSLVGHKTLKTYKDIIDLGFPSDYQILCNNCNIAKNQYKICPHKRL